MIKRYELNSLLKDILGSDRVYYQAPENLKLEYPCILYKLSDDINRYGDNGIYNHMRKYTVTIIDKDPDSEIAETMRGMIFSRFVNAYTEDNLNHQTFNIYY